MSVAPARCPAGARGTIAGVGRRLLGLLAALTLAASLPACTAGNEAPPPGGTVTESNGPAGAVPEALGHYYGQSISWGPCRPYATTALAKQFFERPGLQCARLKAPLDYAEPGGKTITIGVLRTKAADPDRRIGSLVLNPGGPGGSGMEAAVGIGFALESSPVTERFDVVGFDPRGVGASEPAVKCLTGPERDADRADDSETDGTPKGVQAQEAEERTLAQRCAERTEHGKEMLANLGTRDVVRDMDVLRSALGDEKLTYLGYSYGTRIGYAYAAAFPKNVRAMLLDGAVDPEQNMVESLVAQGEGFGVAFGEFVAWCAKRQDCALGSDKAAATKAYQGLVRPLIKQPVSLADGRKLSYEDATTGTVQALYSQDLWEDLNSGLNELKRNRGEKLMELSDQYNDRQPDGSYSTNQDAFTAIHCVDDPPVTNKAEILEAQRRYAKAAPFLDPGTPLGAARDACAYWPTPNTSKPQLADLAGVPPALVVSTTNDPATPYEAGVRLAEAMDGALLTFEGTQHTVFGLGVPCVDEAGSDYLIDGKLPPKGKRCRA